MTPKQKQILARIDELMTIANEMTLVKVSTPVVKFNLNLVATNGRCKYTPHAPYVPVGPTDARVAKCTLEFDNHLVEHHFDQYIATTVPHELAHAVSVSIFGTEIKPHGREWKATMRAFGASPDVRNSYPTQIKNENTVVCSCDCGKCSTIGKIRAKRIREGTREYFCTACRSVVRLVEA